MKNVKTNINFMTKNLQIDVIRIRLVPLKQYNKWMFWITFLFICDMIIHKTYIASITSLL